LPGPPDADRLAIEPCPALASNSQHTRTEVFIILRNINDLSGSTLQASDGEIGRCQDFLFDDRSRALRYMVAKTAKWLPGRKVVISPFFIEQPDPDNKQLPLRLTRKQVEGSPPLDEHEPVSRKYEKQFHQYYALPFYWAGPGPWAVHPALGDTVKPVEDSDDPETDAADDHGEAHLRSCNEVSGYVVEASDGEIGHVVDFVVDDNWVLRYLVIDTRNWLPGRKVLVPMSKLESVQWSDRSISVEMTKEEISNSPEYDPAQPISQDHEVELLQYHERPIYVDQAEHMGKARWTGANTETRTPQGS
jgi:hypothetical protein